MSKIGFLESPRTCTWSTTKNVGCAGDLNQTQSIKQISTAFSQTGCLKIVFTSSKKMAIKRASKATGNQQTNCFSAQLERPSKKRHRKISKNKHFDFESLYFYRSQTQRGIKTAIEPWGLLRNGKTPSGSSIRNGSKHQAQLDRSKGKPPSGSSERQKLGSATPGVLSPSALRPALWVRR